MKAKILADFQISISVPVIMTALFVVIIYAKVFGGQKKGKFYLVHTKKIIYTIYLLIFAIKTCLTDENGKEQIVGNLPLELSRFAKYLLDRGSAVTAKLTSTHCRRSVLVQGGLEIPCQLKAEMIATEKNKRILAHNLDLVNKTYKDLPPEKEIIVGSFLASENSQESETNNSVQISAV